MLNSWTRMLKSVYRQEPITSFVGTAAAVNVAFGGVTEHWSLMTAGLGVMGVAIALRFWQSQTIRPQRPVNPSRSSSRAPLLPPAPSTLPPLTVPKGRE